MQRFTLTPGAAVALFVAHRARQVKSVDEIRAAVDAERWFVGDDPVIRITQEKVKDADGKDALSTRVEATFTDPKDYVLEDRVYEHLKESFKTATSEGKIVGWAPGQIPPGNALEVEDGFVRGAERFEAPKAPPVEKSPRLVEGKKKAAGA